MLITDAAAGAANATGEHALAIALSRRAIELVDARAEPLRAGLLHARLARFLHQAGRGDEARRLSAHAVELTPREPTRERALVLEAHARLLLLAGRVGAARPAVEEAIAIARALGARDVEASALSTRVITLHGSADAAAAAGREALQAARAAGDPQTLLRAHVNAAEALDQAGQVPDAIDLAQAGVEEARRVGADRGLGTGLRSYVAHRLVKLGRLDEAATVVEDALRWSPSGVDAASLHQTAAVIAAHRGDADAAAAAVARSKPHAVEAGAGMWNVRGAVALAEVALWARDADRACAIVDDAFAALARRRVRPVLGAALLARRLGAGRPGLARPRAAGLRRGGGGAGRRGRVARATRRAAGRRAAARAGRPPGAGASGARSAGGRRRTPSRGRRPGAVGGRSGFASPSPCARGAKPKRCSAARGIGRPPPSA